MKYKPSVTIPGLSITVAMVIMVLVTSNLNWSKDYWKDIIEADAKGNYAYLPAVFIYHDLNFGFFERIEKEKYYNEHIYYDYRSSAHGKTIDKYFCGTAVAQLPFFLVAHVYATVSGRDADGFSKPYPVLISVAALFYLLLGLIYLKRLLKLYGIDRWNSAIVLVATVFATNVFYYTIGEPGMSHIYSFAFAAMFLYYGKRYFLNPGNREILLLAVLAAIIILIRPVNGIILLSIPFLAGRRSELKSGLSFFLARPARYIPGILLTMLILSVQPVIYLISTGHFWVDSYGGEKFNFLHPHMTDILFSYKKGLFLYSPIFLLALTGGYFLWKSNRFEFCALFAFFFILTFVLSSWWNWWYGGSFSSRVYLEYIPFFAILLGMSLNSIKTRWLFKSFVSVIFLLIVVCQIQTYQYRYYYIHWENMTKEKYWDVFLRVDRLK
jgi:hypothetical protein